jgi:gamma-glutamylcyclotransferase (GGCT)/AIG2-like uncharacterized protein YtfP
MTNLVAVYGSLRKGLHNHKSLGDSELIGEGVVKGFGMYSLGSYPALSRHGEKTPVVVEVYEVNPVTMSRLDNLEGFPEYYTRKLCPVSINGESIPAWVYYMDRPLEDEFVKSGDWVEYFGGNADVRT